MTAKFERSGKPEQFIDGFYQQFADYCSQPLFFTDSYRDGVQRALRMSIQLGIALGGEAMSNETIICLEDRVQDVIDHNPYLAKKNLRCEASEGHVVLRGKVRSFFQKQMAQESVRRVDGIVTIENCLEVVVD